MNILLAMDLLSVLVGCRLNFDSLHSFYSIYKVDDFIVLIYVKTDKIMNFFDRFQYSVLHSDKRFKIFIYINSKIYKIKFLQFF